MENRICVHEIDYLAEGISKLNVGSAGWFLTVYSAMWEKRNDLNTKLLSKKEAELKNVENSQPVHMSIPKKQKVCLEENTKDVAERPFDKEISVVVNHLINH